MALFQNSVINKYLQNLDRQTINAAYARFDKFFHNPVRQENIRNSKEEQYQGEFLIDLFVNILGYTKNPTPAYNLTTEYKNVKDSKKADGAIIINEVVKAVIELKGTDTTDLNKIENQAFGYKNNQPDCAYVIISNFEKLRFYIDNAIEHIEFNLFTLTETEFELLYLCLAYDNLKQGIPKQVKDESLSQEGVITKKLYNDYSLFKRELHQNLVALNPDHDPLELFKKSQKLLDRFLFLFFAEDRLLLPPNSVRLVLDDWRDLQDRDVDVPLYERFKKYFEYLNTGYKGKRYDVFAYNGGLFKPDEILDAVKIDSELLYRHTFKLSEYDFASEVDVNILGHIFENSLNELDEIKAQLAGQAVDKTSTKRKKDGVFYTPKYITKYIVENTLGRLCTEQKAGMQLNEDDYTGDKRKNKPARQALSDKLTAYRNWLLQLTICDPACGSGAFLNQALDFLIKEHQYIDELHAKLYGDAMVLSDIEKSILENNLFGVDLNEESVEIAKLSLWLRTARPNRKLNDLNSNIKCGNSLIDDPAVAGDKAFNWQQEFPQVFEKGGFDIVIGNPPYLGGRDWKDEDGRNYQYFIENYEVADYQFDMYAVFWEKGVKLIKKNGYIGFITPNTWLNNLKTEKLRNFILLNTSVVVVADYSEIKVFEDAVVLPVIFILKNSISQCKTKIYKPIDKGSDLILSHEFSQQYWLNEDYKIININIIEKEKTLNNKIQTGCRKLEDLAEVKFGIKIYETGKGNPPQLPEFSENHIYESNSQVDNTYKRYLEGKDVNSYSISWESRWLKYGENLAAPRDKELFVGPRLLVRRITGERLISTYIEEDFVTSQLLQIVKPFDEKNAKWILAILNSSLMVFFFKRKYNRLDKTFPEIRIYELRELPIKVVSTDDQHPFIEKADLMLSLNKELQETSQRFQRTMQRRFELAELPGKLQEWYLLSYADFIKELGKKKIKMSLAQEAEWEEYFLQEAKRAQELKATIDATDKAIDQMVYELYGLTEDEIKIVEGEK